VADTKLSALTAAATLTGTELVYAVQGGASVKTTTQDIADLASVAPVVMTPITVTYGASTTIDVTGAADSRAHRMTLTGALTLNFTGAADGQKVWVELIQDGTGSRVVTLGTSVAYGTTIPSFVATTTASKKDILGFVYSSSASKYLLVGVAKGF
jgi:hypothetical protein